VPHPGGGPLKVGAHDTHRLVDLVVLDRLDEGQVLLGALAAHLRRDLLGLLQRHQQRSLEARQQQLDGAVVGGVRHPGVELHRHAHVVGAGGQRLPGAVAERQQVLDVLLGGALADQRDDPELQHHAQLGDVLGGHRGHRQVVEDALADALLGRRAHEGAAAGADADLDQPVGLQHAQRLPHGHPADAEVLAELALGRQPVARLELALAHQQADLVDDDPRDAPGVDAVEQPGGHVAASGATGPGAGGGPPGPLGARTLVQRARATHNGSLVFG
jgi:hypothetical protein